MQKIVITGGLGYIGGELCKLYSGETRYKNIVVVDNKFLASQVKQITDWGMTYVQASILDEPVISKLISDADIVYHFAGVTDVPHTKSESNDEKNKQIEDTAIRGTNIILNSVSDKCKLIFPSTHVVFEGLTETKFDVDETQTPCPTLSYAKCKYKNELDIQSSDKNYLILRLSSVYGLSGDTMRINIMPNLFSKFAALGLPIKMFSGGIQYKSLVSVKDVARSFKYLAESNYSREVFHISNDNVTVKQVAEICKKYKPSLQLLSTNDEIPNLGYTLSNKKLLSTGFKFLYTLDESIKEMIESWSVKTPIDLEYVITGSKEFVDDRGKISNYELPEPINLIGYIESKAGNVRANHYHPIQEQKCLLIKGSYISVIKDLSDPKAPIQTQIIKAGDVSVIQPNVAHTMVFLEDSIFLNLVRGEREHENYGVTHTIPYKLVDDKFKNELLQNYATKCRSSDSKNLKTVVSLGLSPLANNLLNSPDQPDELYPLEMTYCPDSHNCQLSYVVPENKMFDNYLYVSSTTKTFRDHFEKAANDYVTKFKLNQNSFVVDIGSNDGIALKPLKSVGVKVLGVEPAKNIAEIANNKVW
jgi:methylation protein EvaC